MNWYYVENGQRVGPVNDGNLNRLLKEGTVKPDTLVWRDGLEKFVPYSQMTIGAKAIAEANATTCMECGRTFAAEELTPTENGLVCAACKPIAELKLQEEGDGLPEAMRYAGFGIRVAARLIDMMILFTANVAARSAIEFAFPALGREQPPSDRYTLLLLTVGVLLQIPYFTWFTGRVGATPGKIACGLKVVRADGSPLTYGRAFGRYFAEALSTLTVCIGYLMVAFDSQKRALHDRVCDTRVIKV